MAGRMRDKTFSSEFIQYLIASTQQGESDHLPSLSEISQQLGISVARLREQLEVARALGLVEVRPRTGIRRLPYSFYPAVRQSLSYCLELDRDCFKAFADLRKHVEAAYWDQAVRKLTEEDHARLHALVASAWEKLRGVPVQIPHFEHRELHLTVYRRLANPFVLGILEAYWEAYEDYGLNLFADYTYLEQVWSYHQKMVDAICQGDYETGYQALVEHTDLIRYRLSTERRDKKEILSANK
jgi:DNA-binding FadR family transcriptional regulator